MIHSRRRFLNSAGMLTAAAVLGGCSKQVSGTPTAGATVTSSKSKPPVRGAVSLGVAVFAPYAYLDDDGELTGEVVEVCQAALKSMGIDDVKIEILAFEALLPALAAERMDIVGGMWVTEERCARAAWSVPDHVSFSALAVPKGNPKGLKTFDDVAGSDARLAVLTGTADQEFALRAGIPPDRVLAMPATEPMLAAVLSGDVDCGVAEDITLRSLVRTGSGFSELEVSRGFTPEGTDAPIGAFGFREEDTELRDAFNEALTELHDSGEWLEIVEKFDFTEDNRPDADADEACGR